MIQPRSIVLAFALSSMTAATLGCPSKSTSASAPAATSAAPAAVAPPPSAAPPAAPSAASASLPKECDDYLKQYQCVLAKKPAKDLSGHAVSADSTLDRLRTTYTKMASTPQGAKAAADACTDATKLLGSIVTTTGCGAGGDEAQASAKAKAKPRTPKAAKAKPPACPNGLTRLDHTDDGPPGCFVLCDDPEEQDNCADGQACLGHGLRGGLLFSYCKKGAPTLASSDDDKQPAACPGGQVRYAPTGECGPPCDDANDCPDAMQAGCRDGVCVSACGPGKALLGGTDCVVKCSADAQCGSGEACLPPGQGPNNLTTGVCYPSDTVKSLTSRCPAGQTFMYAASETNAVCAKTCSTAADCGKDQECTDGQDGTAKGCTPKVAPAAVGACKADADCRAWETNNGFSPGAAICADGSCTRPDCTSDADCLSGRHCSDGACVP